MKALFTVLVFLAYFQLSSPTCSPDIHLDRTNSTIYLCDVNNSNLTFVLSKSPDNSVDWTLEGKRYKVLGSEACLPGQGYTHDAENFVCNPDLTLTADKLGQLLIACSGKDNLPVWNGIEWICSEDFDILGMLNCSNDELVKYINGSWTCAPDNDILGELIQICPGAFFPTYHNGEFGCQAVKGHDSDTLRDLIPNCTNNYIPKFVSGRWACEHDNNFLGNFTCPLGLVLKRSTNTTWSCGPDHDTFRDLTQTCRNGPSDFDTPVLNTTGWTCIKVPILNVSSAIGTVLYFNNYEEDEFGDIITDAGNYPVRIPYPGTIKAFAIRTISFEQGKPVNVSAAVLLNGVEVESTILVQSFYPFGNFGNTALSIPTVAGDEISAVVNATGAFSLISTEIYVQLNATSPV